MLRYVLFDLGGVLFDFDHRIASRALAARCHLAENELFDLLFQSGLEEAYDLGTLTTKDVVAELRRSAGYAGSIEDFREDWGNIFRAKSDSWKIVDRLAQAGMPLGVVSNTNEAHFDVLGRMTDFPSRFRWLFLSFRLRCRKPDAKYYESVLERLPFPAADGLFIDDRAENLTGAVAAGFQTHLFRDVVGLEAELADL